MVDLDTLARDARRTAEWSRARMAARAGFVVAGLTAVAVVSGGHAAACACFGVVLLVAVVGLRFWSQEGSAAARLGLLMGAVPLLAAALLTACGVRGAPSGQLATVELFCIAAGVAAGIGLAMMSGRTSHGWRRWMLATAVAGLTASLGCIPLGTTGLLVTLAAVVMASAAVRLPIAWASARG